ncbi:uncharacterized protein (DUF1697 family) [Microbacterium halimionae]|uniref:Uncharacterized protein (DUF1697 family) n=1 Tax=Microbacterium halimionae TaxID=1526413 RepID=A0A7W3JNG1_9MICO|nr:DUF1697 domain-containing protein [Microbacterium halimionae]MBA8816099.1 uncharacterized protein (DUF1697 family) [Microbacterium halimionae]NII96301.1 uncharacterized protein (DUF1697 family) [Microbacterium halimionae]
MTLWVALLRGVNVGGVTVKNNDLVDVFGALGFSPVRAILASGNVVFETMDATADRETLAQKIEGALRARFSYDARVHLRNAHELGEALTSFPFDASDTSRQPYIVFCLDGSTVEELTTSVTPPEDPAESVTAGRNAIYWWPVKGRSTDTPFAKTLTRAVYKARTTTRNVRTVERILAAMHQSGPTT